MSILVYQECGNSTKIALFTKIHQYDSVLQLQLQEKIVAEFNG